MLYRDELSGPQDPTQALALSLTSCVAFSLPVTTWSSFFFICKEAIEMHFLQGFSED